MPNYYDSQDKPISLTKEIARGGEGIVWQTNRSGYLAKTYHQQDPEQIKKLKLMVANPPQNPTASQNHTSISWPTDLIKDNLGKSPNWVGFLMPEIRNTKGIFCVYHPKSRKKNAPQYNWYCLHIMALNVAAIVREVHAKNYVIGDLNPKNILVNQRSLVCLIDTDSFQVTDPTTRKVYRCSVGFPGFSPPELIGKKKLSKITQKPEHDRFRLAVMIHHLLFGAHPFMGKWTGSGNPPGQDEAISKGYWPYAKKSLLKRLLKQNLFQPTPNTIPLNILHPKLEQCFLKCFNDGHKSPGYRPSPEDWVDALQVAINDLVVCSHNKNHIYSQHLSNCCWCDRANNLGVDIFPSVSNPIPPKKVSLPSPQSSPKSSSPSSQSSSLQAQNNLLNQRIQQLQSQNNLLNQQIQNLQTENNLLNQEISLLKQQLSSQNKLGIYLTQLTSFSPIKSIIVLKTKPLQIWQNSRNLLTHQFQQINIKLSSQKQRLVGLQQWLATNPKLKFISIGVFVAIVLIWLSSR